MSFLDVSTGIRNRWGVSWSHTATAYENVPYNPVSGTAWTRLVIRDGLSSQASLGTPSIDRHAGLTYAQIFTPSGKGEERGRWLADKASTVFRKVNFRYGVSDITFGVPYVSYADVSGDDWFQINVVCPFTYDVLT